MFRQVASHEHGWTVLVLVRWMAVVVCCVFFPSARVFFFGSGLLQGRLPHFVA